MILIIGGAYQGKLDYAFERYGKSKYIYECSQETIEINFSREIINSFHLLVLAQMRKGIDTVEFMHQNIDKLRNKIIISEDISCGVVPIDKEMRLWREALGHNLCYLSKESDEVIRVFYGIGTKIK